MLGPRDVGIKTSLESSDGGSHKTVGMCSRNETTSVLIDVLKVVHHFCS